MIAYVTLSHLSSKESMRIHKPCILHSRHTTKCTPVYIQMYPKKVVHIKGTQHFDLRKSLIDYP